MSTLRPHLLKIFKRFRSAWAGTPGVTYAGPATDRRKRETRG
jgi:hypothetical protein